MKNDSPSDIFQIWYRHRPAKKCIVHESKYSRPQNLITDSRLCLSLEPGTAVWMFEWVGENPLNCQVDSWDGWQLNTRHQNFWPTAGCELFSQWGCRLAAGTNGVAGRGHGMRSAVVRLGCYRRGIIGMRKGGRKGPLHCQMKALMKALVGDWSDWWPRWREADHFINPERNQAANTTNVNRSNRCSNLFVLKISSPKMKHEKVNLDHSINFNLWDI